MGQDTQQLRQEISATRQDLGQTMDAFEDRVSPSRILERKKSRVKESVNSLSQKVMGNIDYAKGAVTHTAGDIKSGTEEKIAGVQSKVGQTGEVAHDARDAAMHQAQGTPLLAGAVAMGLGFVASVIFPGTKAEGQVAQRLTSAAQPLVDEARSIGGDIASSVKEQSHESAEQLRESAMEHAQEVKGTAQEVADGVRSDATDKVADAKNQ